LKRQKTSFERSQLNCGSDIFVESKKGNFQRRKYIVFEIFPWLYKYIFVFDECYRYMRFRCSRPKVMRVLQYAMRVYFSFKSLYFLFCIDRAWHRPLVLRVFWTRLLTMIAF